MYPAQLSKTIRAGVTLLMSLALLAMVALQCATAQNVMWTKAFRVGLDGTATPGYATGGKTQAVDANGNLFVTGSVFNGTSNDIITYKVDNVSGAVLWMATYDGAVHGDDAGIAITVDAAGNPAVAGYSTDSVGGRNMRTVKYDGATGNQLWSAGFSGTAASGLDTAYAIAADPNGNIVVAGTTYDSTGGYNVRAIKYAAASGNVLWNTAFDNSSGGEDSAFGVATDVAGNVFVTGSSFDAVGGKNIRTMKLDGNSGTILWNASYDGSLHSLDISNGIAVDHAGNVLVAGQSNDFAGFYNFRVIKYSPVDGTVLWASAFDTADPNAERANGLAIDASNNVYVTGFRTDSGGNRRMLTVKFAGSSGAMVWNRDYSGDDQNQHHEGSAVAIDVSGNILVTGYSSDVLGGRNARVLKYDSDGSLLWSAKYDGAFAGRDLATGVSMDAAGNVLISGVTAVSAANDNIFAAKFAGNTGAMMWSGVNPSAPLHTYASAMVAAADGTVAATGYAFFGSSGRGDMATVKYNSAGSILWSRLFQGTAVGISVGKAIAMDNTGNVVVTGVSADSTGGTNNIRTIKYDGGTGTELWNAVFNGGGTGVESGLAVAIDAAGNVAMTGYSNDAGNNQNMRTIKYDGSSGAVLWNAVYAGSGNGADTGNAIRFDSAGNLVVTGSSVDTVGTINMRTIKYNGATGSELWNVNFAGTDTVSGSGDAGNAIAIDNADNVIVTGQSTDTAGLRNMRTIKYLGSTGVAIWNKSFNANGTSDDLATAIAVDANNNVVVTGSNSASGQGTNIRTIKYASQDGAELWNVTYNGDGGSGVSEDTGAAIAVDAAGHVYVNGYSTDAAGAKNMRLIKYDGATGNTKWTHVYAGSANADDTGLSVAIGPASSVYAFGNSNEIGKPLGWLLQRIEEITVPVAPVINSGTPGDQLAVINFTANGTGGSPILSYTAKCTNGGNTFSATGAVSPVSVTGLVNGVSYSCSVTATNAQGNSPASSPVTVTPSALPPLSLSAVVSTKTHGAAGPFNLPVDASRKIYEAITVEPRAIGTGHIITFSFNNPVTSLGAVSAVDAAATTVGSASAVISGKDIVVTLTGIPDRKRIAVGLTGVNNVLNASASIGFLRGNSSQSGTVSDADVAAVKVRAAYVTNNTNYLFDINASGYINAADIAAVKVRKGGALQ